MVAKVLVLFLAVLATSQLVLSLSPYFNDEDDSSNSSDQQLQTEDRQSDAAAYFDSAASVDNDLIDMAQKRSCIRRGGSCDHRRNDCCFSSSCRCNLWGSNCRCHRAGLFQKWG